MYHTYICPILYPRPNHYPDEARKNPFPGAPHLHLQSAQFYNLAIASAHVFPIACFAGMGSTTRRLDDGGLAPFDVGCALVCSVHPRRCNTPPDMRVETSSIHPMGGRLHQLTKNCLQRDSDTRCSETHAAVRHTAVAAIPAAGRGPSSATARTLSPPQARWDFHTFSCHGPGLSIGHTLGAVSSINPLAHTFVQGAAAERGHAA